MLGSDRADGSGQRAKNDPPSVPTDPRKGQFSIVREIRRVAPFRRSRKLEEEAGIEGKREMPFHSFFPGKKRPRASYITKEKEEKRGEIFQDEEGGGGGEGSSRHCTPSYTLSPADTVLPPTGHTCTKREGRGNKHKPRMEERLKKLGLSPSPHVLLLGRRRGKGAKGKRRRRDWTEIHGNGARQRPLSLPQYAQEKSAPHPVHTPTGCWKTACTEIIVYGSYGQMIAPQSAGR